MISNLAHVDPSAKIGENVTIHPFAYVDANVVIGDNSEIMPYASIMAGTVMGKNNKIYQGPSSAPSRRISAGKANRPNVLSATTTKSASM